MTEATYLTRLEAAKVYRVSLPTIARWTKDGTIPFIKIGGRVLIDAAAVAECLKAGKK